MRLWMTRNTEIKNVFIHHYAEGKEGSNLEKIWKRRVSEINFSLLGCYVRHRKHHPESN